MDNIDESILDELQSGFFLNERPYSKVAGHTGISEDEVIKRVQFLKEKGVIRYIGAVLDSNKLGFESTLIAMNVPESKVDYVAETISRLDCVSHNYLRDDDKFNLWFTLTVPYGKLAEVIEQIKRATGINKILNLKGKRVFKIDARFKL